MIDTRPQAVSKFAGMTLFRTQHTTLEGKKMIVWQEEHSDSVVPFKVTVTREGLRIDGAMTKEICTEDELQEFAQFISLAWGERRRLVPKLTRTLTGH